MKTEIRAYKFDDKEFHFYDEISLKTFKELYEGQKVKINDIDYVYYEGYYYPFPNPQEVQITLPDSNVKTVFVASSLHLNKIINLYPNCLVYIKKKGAQDFVETKKLSSSEVYSEIKFISKYEDKAKYEKANIIVKSSEKFSLFDLSIVYNEYLENKYIIDTNATFIFTKERKDFFNFLDKKLNECDVISFCGPEGIGKSVSILAFFKLKIYQYYYINLKKLMEYYYKNDIDKIQELLLRELYHCLSFNEFKTNLNELLKLFKDNSHPLELIKRVIKTLKLENIYIVIDQYKILYDNNYQKLKEIIEISNNLNIKIIVVSSMNELDVKNSIVSILQKINDEKAFSLDYIYITSLVVCDDKDIQKLNDDEKNLLLQYGKTYESYYKIMEEKINFSKQNNYLEFEDYLDNKMIDNFKERLKTYYNIKEDNKILLEKINYLLNLSDENIPIKHFLNNSNNIPFRFFKFTYKNKNIFEIKSISLEDDITLSFQMQKYISFLVKIHRNISKEFSNFNLLNSPNFNANKEAIDLEESFSLLLWSTRKNNKRLFSDMKICHKLLIKDIFHISSEDINFTNLFSFENDAILLNFESQNALAFDCAILKLENSSQKIYSLYLFQITRNKKPNERLTYISINDYRNFLVLYLEYIFKSIKIGKVYFSYIFDFEKPDTPTINECVENKIDYALFDKKLLNLEKELQLKEYIPKIKIFNSSKKILNTEENNFASVKKIQKGEIGKSITYLSKKRRLIEEMGQEEASLKRKNAKKNKILEEDKKNKNYKSNIIKDNLETGEIKNDNIEEINQSFEKNISESNESKIIKEKINELREYLKKINYIFSGKESEIYTTYTQREKVISDYLIMKEKGEIPGISYQTKNQKSYITYLKKEGFSEIQIKNLLQLILKNENDFIIELNKLDPKTFVPQIHYPEFKTFIFAKKEEIAYFIDYLNNKNINLDNKNELNVSTVTNTYNSYYSISIYNHYEKNEKLYKYLNSKISS